MIEFAFPWAGGLLPLPILAWLLVPPARQPIAAIRTPFFAALAKAASASPASGSVVLRRSFLQMGPAVLVWVLLVACLARPEWVEAPIEETNSARDVMLALDVSGSMDERDSIGAEGQPVQRLEAVKGVLRRFIAAREDDRVGLIVFGSQAFVQAPFTRDLGAVESLVDSVSVGMAGPHTVVGDAIGLGIQLFEKSEVPQRLMILLTDGADTSSRMSPLNAAEVAARQGVTVYTIGVGDTEGTSDDRVDLELLEQVARATGGQFFRAEDEATLAAIYDRIDQLAPRETETRTFRPRRSLVHWPAGGVVLLILTTYGLLLTFKRPAAAAGA